MTATAITCISYLVLELIAILQGKYLIQVKMELIYKHMSEERLITTKFKLSIIEKISTMKCLYRCRLRNLFVIKKKLNHSNK